MKKQYIEKSALVAEIERRIKSFQDCKANTTKGYAGEISGLKRLLSFLDTLEVKEVQEENDSVWHDITEEPQYNQNGWTDLIVDSYYGHIAREAHSFDYERWSAHLRFVKNMEFRWAYEKDLI